jgi:hypothetical protein
MSDENKTEQPAETPKRRYREWNHATPEDVALSRKVFFGMMAAMAVLLAALIYGALK